MRVIYDVVPGVNGRIDSIRQGRINGWVVNEVRPAEKIRLRIVINDELIAVCHANLHRADLQDLGIGDGSVAFEAELPPRKLAAGKSLQVLIVHETEQTRFAALTLGHAAGPSEPAKPPREPCVHLDISDLLTFLESHREVSGIQRVQCGYLANLLQMPRTDLSVRACAQVRGLDTYVALNSTAVRDLLDNIEAKRDLPLREWSRYVANLTDVAGTPPDFQRGDVLLTMGAPWAFETYFAAISDLKSRYGISYFQIFYDLIPTLAPEYVAEGLTETFNRATAGMLRYADHILAISVYSARDLQNTCAELDLRCPPVSVIPMGATLDYLSAGRGKRSRKQPCCRERFVLCVCTLEPRKNHLYLYHIWKRLLQELGPDTPKLVCVGRMGWFMDELRRYLQATSNLDGHFVHLENVGDEELRDLYESCLFTVFPSLYEGWGLPVSESLYHGKVCVASQATATPEAGGEWAIYLDPYNVNDGYARIRELVTAPAKLAGLQKKIEDSYHPVTWQAASRQLIDILARTRRKIDVPAEDAAGAGEPGMPTVTLGRDYRFRDRIEATSLKRSLAEHAGKLDTFGILTGNDWYKIETWGCWSFGDTARLAFDVAITQDEPLICYLSVQTPFYAGQVACDISINGRDAGRYGLTGGRIDDLCLRFPVAADRPSGQRVPFRLELHLSGRLHPPPDSADQRILGIGLRSLRVLRESDLAQRLHHLEQRFLLPESAPDRFRPVRQRDVMQALP